MKHVNISFRSLAFALLMVMSSSAAFAAEAPQSTGSPQRVEEIIQEAIEKRMEGIQKEIMGKLATENWEEPSLVTADAVSDVDASKGTAEDTIDNNLSETENSEETLGDQTESDAADADADFSFSLADMVTPFLAILAFLFAIIALSKSNGGKKHSRRQNYEEDDESQRNSVDQQMQQFQTKINKLNREIVELQKALADQNTLIKRLQSYQAQSVQTQTQSSFTQTAHQGRAEQPKVKQILYATRVTGECFPDDSVGTADSSFVVAVLTVSGNKGTFRINPSPSAQQNLLSTFNYGVALISTTKLQVASPQKIETIKEGKVERDGNGWRVTQKADIRLV